MSETKHNKYNKVHRLGKPETEGLLQSGRLRYEEKIDGSNGSFRKETGEEGKGILVCSSHNRVLDITSGGDNRGFCKWVLANVNPDLVPEGLEFYGEWCVSHTVSYDQESYNKFYLYDVWDLEEGVFLSDVDVDDFASRLGLCRLEPLYVGEYQGADHLKSIAEQKSKLGQNQMEGIVIKNYDFRNRYGRQVHAKYVNIGFAEVQKVKPIKLEDFDNENNIIERFVNTARLKKAVEKVVELHNAELDMTLMKYVPKEIIDDIFYEEAFTICTEYDKVNFKQLKKMIPRKVGKLLQEYLQSLIK